MKRRAARRATFDFHLRIATRAIMPRDPFENELLAQPIYVSGETVEARNEDYRRQFGERLDAISRRRRLIEIWSAVLST